MKNILLLSLFCLGCLHSVRATQQVVMEADDDFAPYSCVEKGQHKGVQVDFLKKVAELSPPEYDVHIQPVPWKRGLQNLEQGDSLALFPPSANRERTYIHPYSAPLYRETIVLFCTQEVMKTPHKPFPDNFSDVVIGINLGFALGERMVLAAKTGKIKTEEAKGNDVNDRLSVIHSIKGFRDYPVFKNFRPSEAVELSSENAYIGYSAYNHAPFKADFIAKMNVAIEDAKKAGLTSKLVADYSK